MGGTPRTDALCSLAEGHCVPHVDMWNSERGSSGACCPFEGDELGKLTPQHLFQFHFKVAAARTSIHKEVLELLGLILR